MDIKKEREAFLNVYVNYKGDSRKIQFNEETEQFMWRKNNVSDTEVEYVHLMNQRWYAWLACAKSKAQAVPEGFVLVPRECPDPIFADKLFDHLCKKAHGEFGDDQMIFFSDIDESAIWQLMIEAQEPTND
ncbi:hypothetical protein [Acinetobacter albensis]|uniref:hypothetical protein n=1 Tax=Acinetobacter albensis TaxID=1673609 RepID=UPI001D0E358E|nr:hypothetical protein [Acinetobacter albensis]